MTLKKFRADSSRSRLLVSLQSKTRAGRGVRHSVVTFLTVELVVLDVEARAADRLVAVEADETFGMVVLAERVNAVLCACNTRNAEIYMYIYRHFYTPLCTQFLRYLILIKLPQ